MMSEPADPDTGSCWLVFIGTGAESNAYAKAIAEAADAVGVGRRTLRTFFVKHSLFESRFRGPRWPREGDWEVDWSGFGPASLEWLVTGVSSSRTVHPVTPTTFRVAGESGSRTVRRANPTTVLYGAILSTGAIPPFRVPEPVEALLQFLQRLIRLGRRADASRQLAVQRLRFASRAARLAPDAPPGEVVVSSSRVPRGPDMPRVISTVVDHSRVNGPV